MAVLGGNHYARIRSMNRARFRQVLDCASPLALFLVNAFPRKRQRTGAVRNAAGSYGSQAGCVILKSWLLPKGPIFRA